MNDPIPTPDDDLLRRALQSEAKGVQATDELLDRTLAAASRPAVRPGRRLLAAAAVAAVVIGAGVALTRDDGKRQLDSAGDPSSTTTSYPPSGSSEVLATLFPCEPDDLIRLSILLAPDATDQDLLAVTQGLQEGGSKGITEASRTEVAAAGGGSSLAASAAFASSEDELRARGAVADLSGVAATSSTNCSPGVASQADRPTLVALVREDGWLVVVDLESGDARELHDGGDPQATSTVEEGEPSFIDDVEISPDGEWVYFSTCCEPASGVTYRIPVGGGEPELVVYGAHPRLSPDGQLLATVTGEAVQITRVDGDDVLASETSCCTDGLAWSPDGGWLAALRSTGAQGEVPQVLLFDWNGTALTPAEPLKPDSSARFVAWAPDGQPVSISGDPIEDDRSLRQDKTYTWMLSVDESGVVREQAGHESSARTPIDGLPEALVADW